MKFKDDRPGILKEYCGECIHDDSMRNSKSEFVKIKALEYCHDNCKAHDFVRWYIDKNIERAPQYDQATAR